MKRNKVVVLQDGIAKWERGRAEERNYFTDTGEAERKQIKKGESM